MHSRHEFINQKQAALICCYVKLACGPCRSYRLQITAVRNPASANSVQLAKLDLYTSLDPSTQPTNPLLGPVRQLQSAIAQAAQKDPDSPLLKSVDTLMLVLSNTMLHPAESKYRMLKLENAKIKAMLAGNTEVSNLLKAVGKELAVSTMQTLAALCPGVFAGLHLSCIMGKGRVSADVSPGRKDTTVSPHQTARSSL